MNTNALHVFLLELRGPRFKESATINAVRQLKKQPSKPVQQNHRYPLLYFDIPLSTHPVYIYLNNLGDKYNAEDFNVK